MSILVVGFLLLPAFLAVTVPAHCDTFVERHDFTYFASLEAAELSRAQLKLTYVGEQTIPVPTVVISTLHRLPDLDEFTPYRSRGILYANDEGTDVRSGAVTADELKGLVQAASAQPALSPNDLGAAALTLTITRRTSTGTQGGEMIVNLPTARSLVSALIGVANPSNEIVMRILKELESHL
ncbi:MAG: hypothetical protein GY854_04935 [Deltaproteobacteria bacterium]|nr:hypothetical protein [Deltaproteobacteria bacterium]